LKVENRNIKVIIDTNVLISFLIGKVLRKLQYALNDDAIHLVSCEEQFLELQDVLSRPKILNYISAEKSQEFLDLLLTKSELIALQTKTTICRDSKDNYLVSLAIDSNADYLVTGDLDLLELNNIGKTIVIKYTDFEEKIRKS